MTMRPNPAEFMKSWSFEHPGHDSIHVLIRPIHPEDEPLVARFHATLSERSVYLRYFHMIPFDSRIAHERLARICSVDPHHETVLVAERIGGASEEREILAIARLMKADQANEGEFAVLASDRFQGHGLGTELVKCLLEIARTRGLDRVTADILAENRQMIEICRLLGFRVRYAGDNVVKASLEIPARTGSERIAED